MNIASVNMDFLLSFMHVHVPNEFVVFFFFFFFFLALKEFGMVALHIQPSNVLSEINQLPNIYKTFKGHWNIQVIALLLFMQ